MKRSVLLGILIGIAAAGCGHIQGVAPLSSSAAGTDATIHPNSRLVSKNFVAKYDANWIDPQGFGGAITTGPDGNLWIAGEGAVGKMTPQGVLTMYTGANSFGNSIDSGIDGDLWYASSSGVLGRISTTGSIKFFTLPGGDYINGVAKGPDGNEWFTEAGNTSYVGFITSSGSVTEFPLGSSSAPSGIVVGADKNLWFTSAGAPAYIGRITTSGVVTQFSTPCSLDSPIVKASDGNLWVTGICSGSRDFIEVTTTGTITNFPVTWDADNLTIGPDGQIWGTVYGNLLTFNIKTHVEQYTYVPQNNATGAGGIALGPDGDLWLTPFDHNTNQAFIDVYDEKVITVGVRLSGELSYNDPNYGFELGYAIGSSTQTQTVSLPVGESVVFQNYDTTNHTATFLGDATVTGAPWPASFSGGFTASPAGTAIGTTGFSTGTIKPGKKSAYYETGLPGFYMIGCGYDYDSNQMRTVVIVQ